MRANVVLKVCQTCKATCCKMGGPDFTKLEMQKVLKAGHPNFFVKISDNHYELKSKRGLCPYLSEDNSCSIHEVRPMMCKCWPVVVECDKDKKVFYLIDCPLTPLLSKHDISIMKKQASRIPKEIIVSSFSHSKLSKSDIKLIQKRFKGFKRKPLR